MRPKSIAFAHSRCCCCCNARIHLSGGTVPFHETRNVYSSISHCFDCGFVLRQCISLFVVCLLDMRACVCYGFVEYAFQHRYDRTGLDVVAVLLRRVGRAQTESQAPAAR
jgi:hypothetical protein